jgi:hypothetical protein
LLLRDYMSKTSMLLPIPEVAGECSARQFRYDSTILNPSRGIIDY